MTTTLFCSQYPLHLGISGGLGSDLAVDTLTESDVMVVIGASLNEWTTHFGKILENGKKSSKSMTERMRSAGLRALRLAWKLTPRWLPGPCSIS